jgi:hypothetical protein
MEGLSERLNAILLSNRNNYYYYYDLSLWRLRKKNIDKDEHTILEDLLNLEALFYDRVRLILFIYRICMYFVSLLQHNSKLGRESDFSPLNISNLRENLSSWGFSR